MKSLRVAGTPEASSRILRDARSPTPPANGADNAYTHMKAAAISPISKPIHVEIGKMLATGAAVESTMYASFSRLIRSRSVIGRIVDPTISVFA